MAMQMERHLDWVSPVCGHIVLDAFELVGWVPVCGHIVPDAYALVYLRVHAVWELVRPGR